jgi:hypothetical protein
MGLIKKKAGCQMLMAGVLHEGRHRGAHSAPHFGAAGGLHVAVFDEATLTCTTAGFSAAQGLEVQVANKAALARSATGGGAAMRLLVGVLDKPALATR